MRYVTGILFLLIAGLPYFFMGRGGEPAPETVPSETLAIISPHRREVRLEYSRGFRDWMRREYGRDVGIRWLDVGGTSKILKDIESRFAASPDAPGVDLLFGGGVAPYIAADEQGWLERIPLPTNVQDRIPATCAGTPVYDPHGKWYGVALSGFGILYNRPVVDAMRLPVPKDWEDLADPAYHSWVASGDPRSSGSVHMCYEIILQAYGFERGWQIISRICANVRGFGEAGGTVPREVAVGEVAAGMVIDQYAQTVIDAVGGNLLVLVLPERHTVIGPDAIGMIRGGPSPELARRFVEYVLSPEGQRLLFWPAGAGGQKYSLHRMPVLPELYSDPFAPQPNPYTYPEGVPYDNEKATRRWNVLNDMMGVWLIDSHPDLRRAWRAVIRRGVRPDETARLCAAPVGETDLERLAEAWRDPRRRLQIMGQWSREAQERYRSLTSGD